MCARDRLGQFGRQARVYAREHLARPRPTLRDSRPMHGDRCREARRWLGAVWRAGDVPTSTSLSLVNGSCSSQIDLLARLAMFSFALFCSHASRVALKSPRRHVSATTYRHRLMRKPLSSRLVFDCVGTKGLDETCVAGTAIFFAFSTQNSARVVYSIHASRRRWGSCVS